PLFEINNAPAAIAKNVDFVFMKNSRGMFPPIEVKKVESAIHPLRNWADADSPPINGTTTAGRRPGATQGTAEPFRRNGKTTPTRGLRHIADLSVASGQIPAGEAGERITARQKFTTGNGNRRLRLNAAGGILRTAR